MGLFLFSESAAQPYFDLGGVSSFRSSFNSGSVLHFHNAFFNVPIRSDSNVTIVSPASDLLQLKVNGTEQDLLSVRLTLAHIRKLSRDRKLTFILYNRTNNNGTLFRSGNYQTGAAFIYNKKVSDRLKYSFGLYYNREFFGHFFVPLIGLNYKASEKWQFFGLLPNNFYCNYKLSRFVHTGLTLSFITNSYRLDNADYIRHQEIQFRGYLQAIVSKRHVFFLEAGRSVSRRFTSGTGYFSRDSEFDVAVGDGPVIRAGYVYRIYD